MDKENPSLKASAILYIVSGLYLFSSVLMMLLDIMTRYQQGAKPDTFVEMCEWNAFSQLGAIGIAHALGLFWLGLISDKRGA